MTSVILMQSLMGKKEPAILADSFYLPQYFNY
jgi:hypothetical protein